MGLEKTVWNSILGISYKNVSPYELLDSRPRLKHFLYPPFICRSSINKRINERTEEDEKKP